MRFEMIKKGLLATALLLSGATLAYAQQTPPSPADQGTGAAGGPPPGPGMAHMEQWPGMQQWAGFHHPHGPMMMDQNAHFDISLGRGVSIRVNCGQDAIKACVDATMPLLDKAGAMLDKMPRNPPAANP
jgi:hypothetical protein